MADSGVQSKALVKSLQQLAMSGAIRAEQVEEIAAHAQELPNERWASPFLRDVREHTRVHVDEMCADPLDRPDIQNTAEEGNQ